MLVRKATSKELQLSRLHSKMNNFYKLKCIFLYFFFLHFQWWTSMQLSFDPFRHLQPWSCFLQQLFWFSLWKPMPSGTISLGRLLKVSRLTVDIYCCELNCFCLFWYWLYMIVSRSSWHVASIQGYEEGQLEELGQILSCQRKLRRCQERTRGQMGCKGDQVSVRIFPSSQIDISCSCLCVCLCYSDARELVRSNSGRGASDFHADQAANRWGRNGGDPNVYRPRGLPGKY